MDKKAIILGSGLSIFEDREPCESVSYAELNKQTAGKWPLGKIKGHKGFLDKYRILNTSQELKGNQEKEVWVLRGRAHLYEGFSWEEVSYPTNYLIEKGVSEFVFTNAAGGINSSFEIGDLMQIIGYLNFLKPGLERGNLPNILSKPRNFDTELVDGIHHGVYLGTHGSSYETDAEIALFKSLGADAVGMSTVPELEAVCAYNEQNPEANLKLTAVSIITNVYGKTEDLGHQGVVDVAKASSKRLLELLSL